LRPLATEVVVALDERGAAAAQQLAATADTVYLFSHRDPGDSIIPWLHSQCRGRWILNLDDDEVPSERLLSQLPKLIGADVTHWWLPRRWLIGDTETYLDEPPWVPDYQLRLYRNDPATLRFSDEFHRPVVVSGPAGFARDPLWHLDCVLNSFEHRSDKVRSYERERRGMRVAGVAHNSGFYLPELRPNARTATVPGADVRLIRAALADTAPVSGASQGSVRRASRDEIDALWPGEPFDPSMWAGRLTPRESLDRLPAGARHTVTVTVENHSRVNWPRGPDASPLVQVATLWLDDGRLEVEQGVHTPLPADVPPGGSTEVPVHILAPERPGRYRLQLDLVHEQVRRFDCALEWPVDVRPARRVALIGRDERLEQALDRIQFEPEVEPIIIEPGIAATVGQFGHERIPGLGSYLLAGIDGPIGPIELSRLSARTAKLLRRARRLRARKPSAPLPQGAEECLEALARCELLIVACADWGADAAPTRQLWRLAATVAAARRLGLAVRVEANAIDAVDRRDRLLARLVRDS
jgi:hypothetical protein